MQISPIIFRLLECVCVLLDMGGESSNKSND